METTAIRPPAITVPMAAPVVPNAGIGPHPGMRMTFSVMLSAVSMMPRTQRRACVPGGSEGPSDHEVDHHAEAEPEHDAEVLTRASACTSGAAFTNPRSDGARTYPSGARITIDMAAAVRNA